MHTITRAIDTRPFFLPSVLLEKKRPGNEAATDSEAVLRLLVISSFSQLTTKSRFVPTRNTSKLLTLQCSWASCNHSLSTHTQTQWTSDTLINTVWREIFVGLIFSLSCRPWKRIFVVLYFRGLNFVVCPEQFYVLGLSVTKITKIKHNEYKTLYIAYSRLSQQQTLGSVLFHEQISILQ